MKKCFFYYRFLLGIILFLPLLMSCAHLSFYDREINMKESCVLEFQQTVRGDCSIHLRGENKNEGQIDSIGSVKRIDYISGLNTVVIPAGSFSLGYNNKLKVVLEREDFGNLIREVYKLENFDANSNPFTFEIGKRYRIEIPEHGGTITITEINANGISSSGIMVAPRSTVVLNALGWRYNDGFLFGEFGPRIGLSIASNSMIMHITGEATIGMGIFGGENNGFGFPYRLGGSVITFFGKGFFGLGLGGGVTGQTIMLLGDEDNDIFPKIQVPYIQVKFLFCDRNGSDGGGIFLDYYPTITPINFGTFGIGLAFDL